MGDPRPVPREKQRCCFLKVLWELAAATGDPFAFVDEQQVGEHVITSTFDTLNATATVTLAGDFLEGIVAELAKGGFLRRQPVNQVAITPLGIVEKERCQREGLC